MTGRIYISDCRIATQMFFKIQKTDMLGHSRRCCVARPRQIAMFLARELTANSLPAIGSRFGRHDHTTVMHAIKRVTKLQNINPDFKLQVDAVRDSIIAYAAKRGASGEQWEPM